MKLESLKETKFKDATLKKEQMFKLNGGGTPTPGGTACGTANVYPYRTWAFNFAYDSNRDGVITYHGRSNHRELTAAECAELQAM
jgi:hypothetical protein